ncbi:flavoprotein [Streptomyces sp. NBC_01275]|uniref:flavoprotein n=1 Tax=Streptomyces sp. NBC_01275 TaxID=2903807 RepID=UPI0022512ADC|nr:flavoprotein [Streptomyces sp. NBC_01275]MCX4762880.1 flavoprotein [Streptomyces sp. NBC_01275]
MTGGDDGVMTGGGVPQAPSTPQTLSTPQAPSTPQTLSTPQNPQAPQTSQTPQAPYAPPLPATSAAADAEPPALNVERLLVVAAGSAFATGLPYWTDWLRLSYPELALKIVLTRSAQRFVTRQALAGRLHRVGEVLVDEWPEHEGTARHVDLAEWAQAVVVYPATFHFVARLALGLADSPALLACHCTRAPVAVAPALPPGGLESAAFQTHWATLAARPNIVLAPPHPGVSLTTGRADAWVPPLLPEVVGMLEQRRAELETGSADREAPTARADFVADLARP